MPKISGIHIPKEGNIANLLMNGDMRLSQRGTSFATIAGGTYFIDRFQYNKVGAVVHTASQDSDVPTFAQVAAATGKGYVFPNSLRLNLTTPDTSIAATDICRFNQVIEGQNWAILAQKIMTMSFWVKATATGTYCVALQNLGSDRSFVAEYVVNSSNTWEYKTIVIPASPSAGTWDYGTSAGLIVSWILAAGSNFNTTAGAWQSGNFLSTANQVNGVNTGATDFRITGTVLNSGAAAAPFNLFAGDESSEVEACLRYYQRVGSGFVGNITSSVQVEAAMAFPVVMRTTPTASLISGASVTFTAGGEVQSAASPTLIGNTPSATGVYILVSTFTSTGQFSDQRTVKSVSVAPFLQLSAEL